MIDKGKKGRNMHRHSISRTDSISCMDENSVYKGRSQNLSNTRPSNLSDLPVGLEVKDACDIFLDEIVIELVFENNESFGKIDLQLGSYYEFVGTVGTFFSYKDKEEIYNSIKQVLLEININTVYINILNINEFIKNIKENNYNNTFIILDCLNLFYDGILKNRNIYIFWNVIKYLIMNYNNSIIILDRPKINIRESHRKYWDDDKTDFINADGGGMSKAINRDNSIDEFYSKLIEENNKNNYKTWDQWRYALNFVSIDRLSTGEYIKYTNFINK
eukprot:GHVP01061832.1.p1 GENE.GHVP01061832.1~~GHVP01061832.1.p1  ORF type:complete len:275 (+),score=25.79 GHVP01061832.1:222-1046(+)